ncbi:hypothetical protein [Rhodococcus sp. NPDC058521]|uniref:hypothetical protein n=1 Tax=Rhodococcus sp. NPDC058521 TaxID=3346536 RepID=UPI003645FD0E
MTIPEFQLPEYRPGPIDWAHLDREAAAALWAELYPWTEWLRRRYNLGTDIKGCWFHHEELVEELTAAMMAHREVYQASKNPYNGGAAAWHYQVLWPLIARLRSVVDFELCRPGVCKYRPPNPDVADDFQEFCARDCDNRPEAAAVVTGAQHPQRLDMDTVISMVDAGTANADDPADDFTAVTIDGVRWEYDENLAAYQPAR